MRRDQHSKRQRFVEICYQEGKLEMRHASKSHNTYVTWKTEITYGQYTCRNFGKQYDSAGIKTSQIPM